MYEIINLSLLFISYIGFGYFYLLSIQPKKREITRGSEAWEDCKKFRIYYSMIFLFIWMVTSILWIWFPVSIFNWKITDNHGAALIWGIIISIPFCFIMLKGEKDAGMESLAPSPDTKMYQGIYKYIRHPQTLGEFPLFVTIGIMVNSWFLALIGLIFIIVYTPIMIYFEEKDLILRFGESYKEYQRTTGALFPKFCFVKQKIKPSPI